MVNQRRAHTYQRERCGISIQRFAALTLTLLMTVSTLAAPSGSKPRRSPEFAIDQSSGKQILLSSFQGKAIVIEFLFLRSARCLHMAQTLNQLSMELGPRGFQPVAIVFGPNADMPHTMFFADDFKLTYPVGFATPDKVDSYLARGPNEVLNIPQVVVIDRQGMIRAQSGGKGGDPTLENENTLRAMLDGLLKEPPPTRPKRKSAS